MNTVTAPPWTLGDRIRKARELKGWLQSDLAVQLHKARTTISNWEKGVHLPSYAEIDMIARATGMPLEWLETGTYGEPNSAQQSSHHWYDLPLFDLVA